MTKSILCVMALCATLAVTGTAAAQDRPSAAGAAGALATGILTSAGGVVLSGVASYQVARTDEFRPSAYPWIGALCFGAAFEILGAVLTHHGRVSLESIGRRTVTVAPYASRSVVGAVVTIRF